MKENQFSDHDVISLKEKEIENLMGGIQPIPGEGFYQKMEGAPWRTARIKPGFTRMQIWRPAVSAAIVLLVILSLILLTPQGRVFAGQLLRFFSRADSDVLQPVKDMGGMPTEPPRDRRITDIEALSGMKIIEPGFLPEGLTFYGASYDEKTHTVIQQFGFDPQDIRLSIRQQPFTTRAACDLCGLVGASAPVETVTLGSVQGEYVEGVWKLTDAGPVWENDPFLKTLRWQNDGFAFELIFMGEEADRDKLVGVAQSMIVP